MPFPCTQSSYDSLALTHRHSTSDPDGFIYVVFIHRSHTDQRDEKERDYEGATKTMGHLATVCLQ